jgi:hypothetical protein
MGLLPVIFRAGTTLRIHGQDARATKWRRSASQESPERRGKMPPLSGHPVAIVFGPENGAVSEKLVYEAAREAHAKECTPHYVIGFAIQPNARKLVDRCEEAVAVPATYIQATPDLMMGDRLKNLRSSKIFSVCGMAFHVGHNGQPVRRYRLGEAGADAVQTTERAAADALEFRAIVPGQRESCVGSGLSAEAPA